MARLLSWKEKYFNIFFFLFLGVLFTAWMFFLKTSFKETYYPKSFLSQYYLSAVEYYKQHLFASAYKEIRHIFKIDPDYKDAYILLGDIYRESGLYPEAIRQYKKVVRIDPMDRNAHYKLALLYWNIGNYIDSAREFNILVKKFDLKGGDIINNLASCYSNIGLYTSALEKYKEVLKLEPRYASAYYNIGVIYFNHYQDYERAIKEWLKALWFDPDMEEARVYISNAKIMLKEKRHEQKSRKQENRFQR